MIGAISRRNALGAFGLAAAGAGKLSASIYSGGKVTALVICGDRYHNSDYIRTALGKTLGKDAGLSMDFSDEVTCWPPVTSTSTSCSSCCATACIGLTVCHRRRGHVIVPPLPPLRPGEEGLLDHAGGRAKP